MAYNIFIFILFYSIAVVPCIGMYNEALIMVPRWTIDLGVTGSNPPGNTFWNLDFVRNLLFPLQKNVKSVID